MNLTTDKSVFSVFIVLLVLFASCKKEHIREYKAINNSSDSIEVWLLVNGNPIPVITEVGPKEEKLLHAVSNENERHGVKDDRYTDQVQLMAIKWKSAALYVTEENWKFEQVNKFHGRWTIIYPF